MRTQAIGWLLACALLSTTHPVSAQGVLSGVGRLAPDESSPGDSRQSLARRVAQARALGHLGGDAGAIATLTATLAHRPPAAVRDAVLMSLAERRSVAVVPELLRALRARTGGASLIFGALSAIGGPDVIEALTEIAAGADRGDRELALRSLTRVAPAVAAPLVLQWMADAHPPTRLSGVRIAAARPHALWAEALGDAVIEASAPIDAASITWALSRVADGAGLPALLRVASRHMSLHCAVAIVVCLRAYRDSIDVGLKERALATLRREPLGAPALAWLAAVIQASSSVPTMQHHSGAARRIEMRQALRAAGPDRAATRQAAAIELATMGDPRAHVPLSAALGDPETKVRRAVVRALAMLGRDEARAALDRHSTVEADDEVAALAEAGARGESIAREDPWESARSLLPPTPDLSVDRGVQPLAR